MKKFLLLITLIILIFICLINIEIRSTAAPNIEVNTDELTIYSNACILIEKNTGDILYEKNAYEKMYPASTTKILTAILVLENADMDEMVTVSSSALANIPSAYITANLKVGEEFTVREMLYAMLIPSANDVANVLAEHISGSISAFAELMNAKATEIGLKSSHFTNPSGIHDKDLYTTAYDLSLLARYAMNNKDFREFVSTTAYTLSGTSLHPEADRVFHTSNLLLDSSESTYYYKYATRFKNGIY